MILNNHLCTAINTCIYLFNFGKELTNNIADWLLAITYMRSVINMGNGNVYIIFKKSMCVCVSIYLIRLILTFDLSTSVIKNKLTNRMGKIQTFIKYKGKIKQKCPFYNNMKHKIIF